MKLIFLGPPGAGKGTVAQHIQQGIGVVQISTGDLLRAAVAAGTELGRKAKGYMEAGELVPDALVIGLLQERIAQPDCAPGFILDGFPRTIPQAEALAQAGVGVDAVINFNLADEAIVYRLSARRIHQPTGKVYSINPDGVPRPPAGLPESELLQRADDKPEAILNRLVVYRRQTQPLIEHYTRQGLLRDIDAAAPFGEIIAAVQRAIGTTSR